MLIISETDCISDTFQYFYFQGKLTEQKIVINQFVDFVKQNETPLIFVTSGFYQVEKNSSAISPYISISVPQKSIYLQGTCRIVWF